MLHAYPRKRYAVLMSLSEVIILGLVQGLTEFLPVSSSGHLVAVRVLINLSDIEGNAVDAFLHLGTLLAVLVYYRRVWWGMVRSVITNDEEGKDKRELAAKLALATVQAAVVGYLFQDQVAGYFRDPSSVAASFLATAVILVVADWLAGQQISIKRASFLDAVMIGLAQVIALLPGVSRSGMTIAAGRWRGLGRKQATNFSFLMSAPIIAGASLTSLASLLNAGALSWGQMALGLLVSFCAGLTAIFLLLKVVERISLRPFAIYLVVIAGLLLFVS